MRFAPFARGLDGPAERLADAAARGGRGAPWQGGLLALVDRLLPRPCLGCAELADAPLALGLCPRCRSRLERVDPRRACRGCLRPLAAGRDPRPLCGSCRAHPPPWVRVHALWRYRPPLDAVVRAFKFRGFDFLGPELARAACAALDGPGAPDLGAPELVVPVPLPWTRRLVRGFNQAERFGRPLARGLGIPCREALARPAFAAPQSRLARAARVRRRAGDFRLRRPAQVAGRRVLLVDDVFTTGATARAAATVLEAAGAARIAVLVVAWTPLDGPVPFA